jgi:hypothetical protein
VANLSARSKGAARPGSFFTVAKARLLLGSDKEFLACDDAADFRVASDRGILHFAFVTVGMTAATEFCDRSFS